MSTSFLNKVLKPWLRGQSVARGCVELMAGVTLKDSEEPEGIPFGDFDSNAEAMERIIELYKTNPELRLLMQEEALGAGMMFEGNIGAGKTTLCDVALRDMGSNGHQAYMAMETGFKSFLDDVASDPKTFAPLFQFHMLYVTSRNYLVAQEKAKQGMRVGMDRGPFGCDVFSHNHYHIRNMTPAQFKHYREAFELWRNDCQLSEFYPYYVYLHAPASRCHSMMINRNRKAETGLPLSYFVSIEKLYAAQITWLFASGEWRHTLVIDFTNFINTAGLFKGIVYTDDEIITENSPIYFQIFLFMMIKDRIRVIPEALAHTLTFDGVLHAIESMDRGCTPEEAQQKRTELIMRFNPIEIIRNDFKVDLTGIIPSFDEYIRVATPRLQQMSALRGSPPPANGKE